MTDNEGVDEFDEAYGRALAAGGADAQVDAAASVLAAAGERWDAAGRRTAERVAGGCRDRGWQDADLVRMAGRELTARHHRLAAALAAGEGPAAFAGRERLDRFAAAACLVEVVCLYGGLPRIPPLTAPAGAVRPAAADPGAGKVLGRIRALLAKAESTGFPDEAEALSAKAQQLMARHSVDTALLTAGAAAPGAPLARRIGVERPYEGARALLLDAVAAANGCEAVWSGDFGFSTVVGHPADLDAVELLYTSLLVQADRVLGKGPSHRRDYRESFLIAYASRVRERLTAATAAEVAAHDGERGLLPALAARDLAVRQTTRRLFPSTTTSRLKGRDADGWRQGRSTADAARLR